LTDELRAFGWSAAIHLLLVGIAFLTGSHLSTQASIPMVDLTLIPPREACPASAPSSASDKTQTSHSAAPRLARQPAAVVPTAAVTADNVSSSPPPASEAIDEPTLADAPASVPSENTPAVPDSSATATTAFIASGAPPAPADQATIRDRYLAEHFAYIRELILKRLDYPTIARKRGWCGQLKVSFIIEENGAVDKIVVLASSGYRLLDNEAVETIRRAAPFPPPPITAEIVMPITYQLN